MVMSQESQDFELVIKNGTVVTSTSTMNADIGVNHETITTIGRNLRGIKEIDAAGKFVIPGAVDIHVHMQLELPGNLISSDTFFTGTRAAAFGGTTTIVDFVDPKPEEELVDALMKRRAVADQEVVIDYGLHMTLGPTEMSKLDQVAEAFQAGCSTFKLYMAYGLRLDDGQLLEALEAIGESGGLPVIHAENWDAITSLVRKNLHVGNISPAWHPKSRPAILEAEATGRVIDLATYLGVPIHIFHVSCEEALQRIKTARNKGLPVTGETCPQYLFLDTQAFEAPGIHGALPVCSPPLRSRSDQEALWQALCDGYLQIITTDHCPFTMTQKQRGWEKDFSQIPGGVPSIEMRLAAVYSHGVLGGMLSLSKWVDLCCTTPARLAGMHKKGDIAIGHDADLVIFDPDVEIELSAGFLHENVDWTPYENLILKGWPITTINRGRVVVENGQFKGEPGQGKFIERGVSITG